MRNNFIDDIEYDNFQVDPELVKQGVDVGVQVVGGIVQNKRDKESNKTGSERTIDSACGKRKRFLSKKKKRAYESCKNKIVQSSIKQPSTSSNDEQNSNQKKIVIGVSIGLGVLVLGGLAIYLYKRKK